MKLYKYVSLLLLLVPFALLAQEEKEVKENEKDGFKTQYDVYTKYQPKITDGLKLDVVPVNEKLNITPPPIKYNITTKLYPMEKIETKLPAISIKGEKAPKLNHVFIKAGAGNYANLFAEVDYNTIGKQSKDMIFAVQARHHSGKSGLKNSNTSEQLLKLYGKKMLRDHSLAAKLYTNNTGVHYYGYDQELFEYKEDSLKQNYFNTGFLLSLDNELNDKANFKYQLHGGFDLLKDHYDDHEVGASFKGVLEQRFREHPIHFEAKYNFYNIDQLTRTYNRNILNIVAKFDYIKDNFRGRAGFDVATENDSSESKIHFYPNINLEGDLFDNKLTVYGGFTGGLLPNTYKSIVNENPFVQTDIQLRNTNNKFELYTGVKGSVARRFNYLFKFSYHTLKNLMMFVNDSSETKRFISMYDEGNSTLMKLKAEIHTKPIENLNVFLKADYYSYDLSTEMYPWQLPEYEITLSAKYNLDKKMFFTLDLFTIGDRKAKTWDETGNVAVIDMPSIFDLNAGVTYRFSETFGIFFNFNNILANKYSYWNQYELRGFHLLGGIKANL